jgi:hypothetical protein
MSLKTAVKSASTPYSLVFLQVIESMFTLRNRSLLCRCPFHDLPYYAAAVYLLLLAVVRKLDGLDRIVSWMWLSH